MPRMRSMTARFEDNNTVTDMQHDNLSRRIMLRRLAAIGLVAASTPVLTPLIADAKRNGKGKSHDNGKTKQRKRRRQEKARHQDTSPPEQPEDSPASNADIADPAEGEARVLTIPNPSFYDKQNRKDGVFLTIGSRTANNKRRVTVAGSIAFTREHAALMSTGYTFSLMCEGWGMDSGCAAPSDKEFDLNLPYPRLFNLPAGGTPAAFRRTFEFSADVASSDLNEDVDDGIWDWCDDDQDDIAAYLIVEARPPRGQWISVMRYRTNEVQGYF